MYNQEQNKNNDCPGYQGPCKNQSQEPCCKQDNCQAKSKKQNKPCKNKNQNNNY